MRIEVAHVGPHFDGAIADGPDAFGGFGLRIVGALSSAWGVEPGTARVWAEVPSQRLAAASG